MLSAGSTIASKYRLEEVLGKGATGTVWRAIQLELDRPVALKLLHAQVAANEDAHVRFSREARVAASLDHPSSVAVLDFGEDQGSLYLVMELVTGESLRARLQRGPLVLAL
jgi:eukaryotic-like serine/threonine-protein kinase